MTPRWRWAVSTQGCLAPQDANRADSAATPIHGGFMPAKGKYLQRSHTLHAGWAALRRLLNQEKGVERPNTEIHVPAPLRCGIGKATRRRSACLTSPKMAVCSP